MYLRKSGSHSNINIGKNVNHGTFQKGADFMIATFAKLTGVQNNCQELSTSSLSIENNFIVSICQQFLLVALFQRWYHKSLGESFRTQQTEFTSQHPVRVTALLSTSVFSFVKKLNSPSFFLFLMFFCAYFVFPLLFQSVQLKRFFSDYKSVVHFHTKTLSTTFPFVEKWEKYQ